MNRFLTIFILLTIATGLSAQNVVKATNYDSAYYNPANFGTIDTLEHWSYHLLLKNPTNPKDSTQSIAVLSFFRSKSVLMNSTEQPFYNPLISFEVFKLSAE